MGTTDDSRRVVSTVCCFVLMETEGGFMVERQSCLLRLSSLRPGALPRTQLADATDSSTIGDLDDYGLGASPWHSDLVETGSLSAAVSWTGLSPRSGILLDIPMFQWDVLTAYVLFISAADLTKWSEKTKHLLPQEFIWKSRIPMKTQTQKVHIVSET